ncbi:MAG: transcription-repair coupling factor [Terriglobia bacterium]|jgi:transcription-repair coupling factor
MADLHSLLQPLLEHASVRAAVGALVEPAAAPVAISGLTHAAKAVLIAALAHQAKRPVVVITEDNEAAQNYRQTTATFLDWLRPGAGSSVQVLPALDCSPYESRSPHAEIQEQRAVALWRLARGGVSVIFAPVAAALGRFRDSSFYSSLALELKVGDELNLDDLVEHLRSVGYEPGEPVAAVGQYSVRGGIVDVFPPEAEWPVRLEFFGDQLESVREFDPSSQRSRKPVPQALLLPLSEAQRSPQFFERLVRVLALRAREHAQSRGTPIPDREPDWAAEHSNTFPGWEFFVPLVEPHTHTLFSLLDGPVLVWDEFLDRRVQVAPIVEGLRASFEEVRDIIPPRPEPHEVCLDEAELLSTITSLPQISLKELGMETLAPAAETGAQAVVIGGDLYFPPEGEDFAKELASLTSLPPTESSEAPLPDPHSPDFAENSAEWQATSDGKLLEPDSITAGKTPSFASADDDTDFENRKSQIANHKSPDRPIPRWPDHPFLTQPPPKYQGRIKELVEDLRGRVKRGESIIFVVPTSGKVDRLREILKDYEIPYDQVTESSDKRRVTSDERVGHSPDRPIVRSPDHPIPPPSSGVFIARGEISEGVAFPDLKQLWLADTDLFGGFDWAARGRRERSGISSFISDLSDLKVGDYVVHIDHGIGIYQGLRQISVAGAARDFMLLTFQDEAKLYVPLERLDLVEKYRSHEGAKPPLDRLGGATWERTKTRVKRALRDMAQELLQLYAERKMRGGVAALPDTPWQREFEDAFEFEETPDQITALADIKRDLESPEPMDRLLCGDVGYGKTELAMRAAFKLIQDGRQVAVLAPTTVLAFQHHTTFRQRMAAFPVRVEMLSRFRTAPEQKKIIADVEAGRIDILIGTHRLLSKDLHLRNLGLLIVDEEQRFGVAAKEKLKKLKSGVDVLTMSATPIPRTLHMSLGGLRDLSVIETPPRGRLAIQTTVVPFNQALIQSAIMQEMQRQGQVFFVHNRVESIFQMAALLQRLLPTARLGVAHGQMGEKELELAMLKFMRGDYDVLVATSLIENGLDIPRANTIMVNHADRFGLADLYQLRGRVGRSNRRAYAYLLIGSEDTLTPIARRRLAAMKEFSDLGAGFRLAALDLELRGAGNLLGAEQHGHLNAMGIDLYLKMLEQTVEELRGAPAKIEVRTSLNLGLDIKIPDSYIPDENQRLRMYKRISSAASPSERADMEAELADRFGPIPPSVSNLLDYALLKSVAERLLVQTIERKGDEIWIKFHEQAPVDPQRLAQFVRCRRESSFRPDRVLRFRGRDRDGNLLTQVQNVLQELQVKT